MADIKNVSMISLMNELLERDNDTQGKLYDASCIMDKIKLIAYGFSDKYGLNDVDITEGQQRDFLNARSDMRIEISILSDYIQRLDNLIESIGGMRPVADD